MNPTARRRGANRAEAREEFELERVLSCCNGDRRRRAELDLAAVSGSTTIIGPPHLGQCQRSEESLVEETFRSVCVCCALANRRRATLLPLCFHLLGSDGSSERKSPGSAECESGQFSLGPTLGPTRPGFSSFFGVKRCRINELVQS